MELHETEERQDLRKAVAEIAKDFGHEYYLEKSLAGGKSTELWQAVGKQGFLGVNLSEQYGGGAAASTTCRSSVRSSPRRAARC
ncbi:Probable acyl-CoA dehydrogenase FadE [Mycobacteroides abscessus]|nr:Probable acyl-CoA dehydrogenase FadE [Mycobacteroides abscessus]